MSSTLTAGFSPRLLQGHGQNTPRPCCVSASVCPGVPRPAWFPRSQGLGVSPWTRPALCCETLGLVWVLSANVTGTGEERARAAHAEARRASRGLVPDPELEGSPGRPHALRLLPTPTSALGIKHQGQPSLGLPPTSPTRDLSGPRIAPGDLSRSLGETVP